jgi:multimeric flavodoxin WrbA
MPAIRVLGICGSPRRGNSWFLLGQALEGARSVGAQAVAAEAYSFQGKTFQPCRACGYCSRNQGSCVIEDDFEELRAKWLASDVILYSVPIYHMGIPGQLKCFIDRLGNTSFSTYALPLPEPKDTLPKLLKVIGSIVQGVHIFAGQEHTLSALINHALVMQSIPVAGDAWESYIGCGGWTQNDMGRNGLEKLAGKEDLTAQATMRASAAIGRRCVEMAMIIRAGVMQLQDHLKKDPLYGPLLKSSGCGNG